MATESLDALLAELENEEINSVVRQPPHNLSSLDKEPLQREWREEWQQTQLDQLLAEISRDGNLTDSVADIGWSPAVSRLESPLLGDAPCPSKILSVRSCRLCPKSDANQLSRSQAAHATS